MTILKDSFIHRFQLMTVLVPYIWIKLLIFKSKSAGRAWRVAINDPPNIIAGKHYHFVFFQI